jgi:hypothetical protein
MLVFRDRSQYPAISMQFQWNTGLPDASASTLINAIVRATPVKLLTDGNFSLRENGNDKKI